MSNAFNNGDPDELVEVNGVTMTRRAFAKWLRDVRPMRISGTISPTEASDDTLVASVSHVAGCPEVV